MSKFKIRTIKVVKQDCVEKTRRKQRDKGDMSIKGTPKHVNNCSWDGYVIKNRLQN